VTVNNNGTVNITLTGSDADIGDNLASAATALTFSAGNPAHGSVSLTGAVATYTPTPNYSGPDSFSFKVNDGTVDSLLATVTITVNAALGNDFTLWLAESGLVANPGTDSDQDSINNAVEYVIGGRPASGNDSSRLPTVSMVVANPRGNLSSSEYLLFTYRRTDRAKNNPSTTIKVEWDTDLVGQWTKADETHGEAIVIEDDAAAAGIDFVKVYIPRSLAANGRLFARLSVFIEVAPANSPPVAQNQFLTVNEDGSQPVALTGTGLSGTSLTFTVTKAPLHGTLSGVPPLVTYTPTPNYNGFDSFSFKANDGSVDSPPATVSITVISQEEYTQWMTGFSLDAAPGVDSDGDSISNAVEYVIGGNPVSGNDSSRLPTLTIINADPDNNLTNIDYLLFTYRRTDLAKTDPSTTIGVVWNNNLVSPWTQAVNGTSGVVVIVEDDAIGAGIDRVKVYIPQSLAASGKMFARLGVAVVAP
jgi:hypothetical protein